MKVYIIVHIEYYQGLGNLVCDENESPLVYSCEQTAKEELSTLTDEYKIIEADVL